MTDSKTKLSLLLVGATGEVGRAVLAQALADPRVDEVMALTRRALSAAGKLNNIVVDFDVLPETAPWWFVDAVICTTRASSQRSRVKIAMVFRCLTPEARSASLMCFSGCSCR